VAAHTASRPERPERDTVEIGDLTQECRNAEIGSGFPHDDRKLGRDQSTERLTAERSSTLSSRSRVRVTRGPPATAHRVVASRSMSSHRPWEIASGKTLPEAKPFQLIRNLPLPAGKGTR
jgi:hypothetical protein